MHIELASEKLSLCIHPLDSASAQLCGGILLYWDTVTFTRRVGSMRHQASLLRQSSHACLTGLPLIPSDFEPQRFHPSQSSSVNFPHKSTNALCRKSLCRAAEIERGGEREGARDRDRKSEREKERLGEDTERGNRGNDKENEQRTERILLHPGVERTVRVCVHAPPPPPPPHPHPHRHRTPRSGDFHSERQLNALLV